MRPESESELAEMIRAADAPLSVVGGGTRVWWRAVDGVDLSTAGLAKLGLYEPGALTLVAGAGTPVETVEAVLAEKGQRLAFEPPDLRGLLGVTGVSTLGGVFGANASGPRRVQAGAARDFLLGVRFVDGTGSVVKNGGRVMKNVTGYDLVKLMAGSHGTLGVMTEVSLKVLAVPEREATLVAEGLDTGAALAALRASLGTPFDVSGAAHDAVTGRTLIRVEGLKGSVDYRAGRLKEAVPGPWSVVTGEESAALWRDVRDATVFAGGTAPVWRVSVTPGRAVDLVSALDEAGLAHRALYDWGGGLIWLEISGAADGGAADGGAAVLRAAVDRIGGHATLVRADMGVRAKVPMFHPQADGVERLSSALRARFDPRGILNSGLMGRSAMPAS
ncbi:2-hydroxy-acid oxidase [Oceanicola sp. 22II-s10i]|uniref:FAD-binding protein n=1 Tax=Oceanicola sp. 22II-s10i TaxID=1317116 RepID=UPI000B524FEC|nr:FAD-binding protein [Oceanicola sp. 22II-s10i]OWU86737.1 2-hydroxy-acid oxidase [Oceanicola sp. 22II-s10i]